MTFVRDTNAAANWTAKYFSSGFWLGLATPLTVALFLISGVSGVALFFHWAPDLFHSMHEWLGVVLLAPVMLHLWRNWRPMVGYARRGALYVPLALALAIAVTFAGFALSGGGDDNPVHRSVNLLTQTRLADLAPVLKTTPEELVKSLGQRGVAARSADDTLDGIAAATGKSAHELLASVMPKR
jgi:hypothetical protein